jgi:hypothetical protein
MASKGATEEEETIEEKHSKKIKGKRRHQGVRYLRNAAIQVLQNISLYKRQGGSLQYLIDA